MDQAYAVDLATRAIAIALELSLPLLVAGLAVGLLVSIFQALTQIQEMTLSFIPKIIVTIGVLALAGPWMLSRLLGFTTELFQSIPAVVGK
ncbi:fliQ: flagellar biosynthetic protein FliQ [Gaiella occulta]|uniref:Flagellar biosynthetic protein FliQ n=1 Tax=Gaiella occulta TaxID=1002870 RepID=A0A7M2Z0P1_9ACTN|nr:flagellar biosynthesis protein FliQ [Gaiella occulta]RDI75996.1 fliQ: flagellar biosynthetic protein FliQ [Gaiella occulta]